MSTILHITPLATWEQASATGELRPESLESEGFIHASTFDQVVRVANAFYAGQNGLVLLCIDTKRLHSPIQWEQAVDVDDTFPHIYGPLNADAVTEVLTFEPDASGQFSLPVL
jgi:uncharacterized protein (DUF952 family)